MFLFLGRSASFAQNVSASGTENAPIRMGDEIQNLEQKLLENNLRSAERRGVLARIARLLQLSGDLSGAAVRWMEAAAADSNNIDALTAAAFCYTAAGEWERAASVIRPLLAVEQPTLQVRYLDACLKALVSGGTSALVSLAADPQASVLRPMIYHTLWRAAGAKSADSWKSRLLSEFPQSPEARAAAGTNSGSLAIKEVQSPLWLLFPEFQYAAVPPETVPAALSSAPSVDTAGTAAAVLLQTGVFGREANARSQAAALEKAGFSPEVSRKTVNGVEHWAVAVPSGPDSNKTKQELQAAGFDSFPVKNNL